MTVKHGTGIPLLISMKKQRCTIRKLGFAATLFSNRCLHNRTVDIDGENFVCLYPFLLNSRWGHKDFITQTNTDTSSGTSDPPLVKKLTAQVAN